MQYFVYAIGKEEGLIEPFLNCYIGVSCRLEKRWKEHRRSKFHIGNYIRKYKLKYEKNMVVVFSGTKEDCFLKEKEFRPKPNLGLNEAEGGYGGYTKYSLERNESISNKLKGRSTKNWIHKCIESRRSYSVEGNPNSKKWTVFSPDGQLYSVDGNLIPFCRIHNLTNSTLRKYFGARVPFPNSKYRKVNAVLHKRRMNTVGWLLTGGVPLY